MRVTILNHEQEHRPNQSAVVFMNTIAGDSNITITINLSSFRWASRLLLSIRVAYVENKRCTMQAAEEKAQSTKKRMMDMQSSLDSQRKAGIG